MTMLPQMQPCSLLGSGLLWAHHQDTPTASLQPADVHCVPDSQPPIP